MSWHIKTTLDVATNGSFIGLPIENELQLIERMATNSLLWYNDTTPRKSLRIYETDGITMVNVKLNVLTKKLERMDMKTVGIIIQCEIYVDHMLI